ncbi:uncharacterized protein PHALS_07333 [Plasmopara halstedii]|uniref:Uncharacterized protein n=1 Tax=Plasmopara halstedii TaxID=4781 RepID=A0A0P1B5U5_PLAHL|nr:uncharacterized protein PHALS_07333 [Plasmopara halstedii]CEG49575.1 hypothetical protein PHALS_07333 [Plasmopara halstedii]|eukprot:XP_024585944.1 hypothetical protein PHALS_07333 [Plasmopara halstedii]
MTFINTKWALCIQLCMINGSKGGKWFKENLAPTFRSTTLVFVRKLANINRAMSELIVDVNLTHHS